MPKHVIPKETSTEQLGIIHPLSEEVLRKARLNAAYRLERLPLTTKKREVFDLLQALGLADYEPTNTAKTNATTGATEYERSEAAKEKARVRKQAWRLQRKDQAS